jgi:hypothetical protein
MKHKQLYIATTLLSALIIFFLIALPKWRLHKKEILLLEYLKNNKHQQALTEIEQYKTGFNEYKLSFMQSCFYLTQGSLEKARSFAVTANNHTANKHEDEISTILLNIINILENKYEWIATDPLRSKLTNEIKTIFEFYKTQKACKFHLAPNKFKGIQEWIDEIINQTQFYHRYHIDNLSKHILNSSSNRCINITEKYDFISSDSYLNDHNKLLLYIIKIKHIIENPLSFYKNDIANDFPVIEPILVSHATTMPDRLINHLRKMVRIISLKVKENGYKPLFTTMLDLHQKIVPKKDQINLSDQIVEEHMNDYGSYPAEFNIFMMSTLKTQPTLKKSYFKAFRELFQTKTTLLLPKQFMKYYPLVSSISSEHNNLYQVIEQSWLENLYKSIKVGMPGEVQRLRQTLNYMIESSFFLQSATSQIQFNNKILQLVKNRFQLTTVAPICEYLIHDINYKNQVGELINTELVKCCCSKQNTDIYDGIVFLKKHNMNINKITIAKIEKHIGSIIREYIKSGDIQNASKLIDRFSIHDEIRNTTTFKTLAFNTLFYEKNYNNFIDEYERITQTTQSDNEKAVIAYLNIDQYTHAEHIIKNKINHQDASDAFIYNVAYHFWRLSRYDDVIYWLNKHNNQTSEIRSYLTLSHWHLNNTLATNHVYKSLSDAFSNNYILQNTVFSTQRKMVTNDAIKHLAHLNSGELFNKNTLPWLSDSYKKEAFDMFLASSIDHFFKHNILPDNVKCWEKWVDDSKINLTIKLKFYDLTANEFQLNEICKQIVSNINGQEFNDIDTINILAKKGYSNYLTDYMYQNKDHLKAIGINLIENFIITSYYNAQWNNIIKLIVQQQTQYTNVKLTGMIREALQRTNTKLNNEFNYLEVTPSSIDLSSSLSEKTPLSSDIATLQLMSLPSSQLNVTLSENKTPTLTKNDRLFLEQVSLFDFINESIEVSRANISTNDKMTTLLINNELGIAEQILKQNLKGDISGYQSILLLALIKHHQSRYLESNDYLHELHHRIGKNQKTLLLKAKNSLKLYQSNHSNPYFDETIAAFNEMSFINDSSTFVESIANDILNISSMIPETNTFSDNDKQKNKKLLVQTTPNQCIEKIS